MKIHKIFCILFLFILPSLWENKIYYDITGAWHAITTKGNVIIKGNANISGSNYSAEVIETTGDNSVGRYGVKYLRQCHYCTWRSGKGLCEWRYGESKQYFIRTQRLGNWELTFRICQLALYCKN
jgi:hypothetical protein